MSNMAYFLFVLLGIWQHRKSIKALPLSSRKLGISAAFCHKKFPCAHRTTERAIQQTVIFPLFWERAKKGVEKPIHSFPSNPWLVASSEHQNYCVTWALPWSHTLFKASQRLYLTATDMFFPWDAKINCTGKLQALFSHFYQAFTAFDRWCILLLTCMKRKTFFNLLFCSLYNLPGSFSLTLHSYSLENTSHCPLSPFQRLLAPYPHVLFPIFTEIPNSGFHQLLSSEISWLLLNCTLNVSSVDCQ